MNSSTVHRFLSKRDKNHDRRKSSSREKGQNPPSSDEARSSMTEYHGLFANMDQKIKALHQRMLDEKQTKVHESMVSFALHSKFASKKSDKAFDLIIAISDSWEGLVTDYSPNIKLFGAENCGGVTCYLDSTLFAMFSKLDSFEAMLYNSFPDEPRNRLAMLIRLWVNLLRRGKLITTDITELVMDALVECGWQGTADQQQDASEFFTFITEKLELPLLTLKMDIYHTGREDTVDDHKLVNERLLEVAIPPERANSSETIRLEDCLEAYFNNRIEVTRYLERRSTINSPKAMEAGFSLSPRFDAVHVETQEVSPETPSSAFDPLKSPLGESSPHHKPSLVQHRFFPDAPGPNDPPAYEALSRPATNRLRSGSIRKEVMMPAWQFFSLIPWYTNSKPTSDAQVASHFSSQRPILGMCLKRYSLSPSGIATRLNTAIDIPTEIGLPHFISDDNLNASSGSNEPIHGNFKLSLQAVVCHRGNSVHSGHYIALVKGTTRPDAGLDVETDQWMRFDDLGNKEKERITLVQINRALREETPYLVFYQIVPVDTPSSQPQPQSQPQAKVVSSLPSPPPPSSDPPGYTPRPSSETATTATTATTSTLPVPTDEPPSRGRDHLTKAQPSQPSSRSGSQVPPESRLSASRTRPFGLLRGRKSREVVPTIGDAGAEDGGEKGERGVEKGWEKEKREKSRNRLSRGKGLSASMGLGERGGEMDRDKDGDRECLVM